MLVNPRGFCAGVRRAIDMVERIIQIYGAPVYVRHELVHNDYVVSQLLKKGVIFVDTMDEIPDDAIVVFSAHGVSKEIREQAKIRHLTVFDATCPLVSKIHAEVSYASRNNMEVILIGYAGHPEVEGTIGQYVNLGFDKGIYVVGSTSDAWSLQIYHPDSLFFVTQTTFSVDHASQIIAVLRKRFPNIVGPKKSDICYATFNRQSALKKLALITDVVFVVGSNTSSNSKRLVELACRFVKFVYLINSVDEIKEDWLYGVHNIGVTAGASVPEILISQVVEKLRALCVDIFTVVEIPGTEEDISFKIPKSLMCLKQ